MELVKSLVVLDGEKKRRISLYHGDLSRIPVDQPVDLLVVSAFPDDYQPFPNTLIGALHGEGLSVKQLAADKAHDLREISGFWMSKPLGERYPNMHVGRIACFEPAVLGQPPQVVGKFFRGLFPFLHDDRDSIVAMPLVAAGDQRWPLEDILDPLVEAACHWLERGLPIAELWIVEIGEDRVRSLAGQFDRLRNAYSQEGALSDPPAIEPEVKEAKPVDVPPDSFKPAQLTDGYDIFLSYAKEDGDGAERLATFLKSEIKGIRVFDFRFSIDVGQSWQREIDDAIGNCRKIVALMSPDYFASPECQEELIVARLRNKRSNFEVIFPLYWRDAGSALEMWLQAITYRNCREGDLEKLADTAKHLAAQLRYTRQLYR